MDLDEFHIPVVADVIGIVASGGVVIVVVVVAAAASGLE